MMKTPRLILTTAIILCLALGVARAGTFNVVFEDVTLSTGVGFADPTPLSHPCGASTLGELRRCTAQQALNDLGNLINFAPGTPPDIVFLPSAISGSDPAGVASQFYDVALGNPQGGFLFSHITTGVDVSPGYDARIKINFGTTLVNGVPQSMNSDVLVIDESKTDLYTIVLHEAMHALGIASLMDANGNSVLTGSSSGPFARFDQFLVQGSTSTHVLSGAPPTFAGPASALTSNLLEYYETGDAVARLPVLSPSPFSAGASLSHLDRARTPANGSGAPYAGLVFDYVMGSGRPVRSVSNPEKDVLCDLGYDLGITCSDRYPIGVNDVGPSTTPGFSVCFNVLANDIDADGNPLSIDAGYGVTIVNGNGPGASASYSAGTICYTPPSTFVGTAALKYCPSDGTRIGNPTTLTFNVTGTTCPGDPCNLICNGTFEGGVPADTNIGYGAMTSCPSMVDNWCAYHNSPDLFVRGNPYGSGIPTFGCPSGVNTWDFPNTANNRFVGMTGWAESMSTPLVTPLVPGATYHLSFHAITGNSDVTQQLELGFLSQNTLQPLDFALPVQTVASCAWTVFNIDFPAPASPALRYFFVGTVWDATNPGYVFVDDFSLTTDGPPLSLTQTVSDATPHVGDVVNYSITVCNDGVVPATSVMINDVLPAELTASGGTFSYPAHTVPTLAPSTCVTLSLEALVTASATADVTLTNCATLVGGGAVCRSGTGSNCADIVVPSTGLICGSEWDDLDADGLRDPNEPGIPGRIIGLTGPDGVSQITVTDPDGNYCFAGVQPGFTVLGHVLPTGWSGTYPPTGTHTIELVAGAAIRGVDFGSLVSDSSGSLRGLDWLHDAFPFNETAGLPGTAAFDTTTALIKTGRNIAALTGDACRLDVPGDSLLACACGDDVRLDLVFRVMPGPGNHVVVGNRASGLRRVPTSPTAVTLDDGSFWGEYLADNGPFGTPGGHATGQWDPNVWNSARMDSAELNLFPVQARGNLPQLTDCVWAGTYHEADLKVGDLGISKNVCFLVDTLGPINSSNITCNSVPAWLTVLPQSRSGWDGNALTNEHTKIIRDGMLTPGSHVQYFLRRSSLGSPTQFTMVPDTNRVAPQFSEHAVGEACSTGVGRASLDGHRWQQFSVLPDRWKEPAFGGLGMACMLYVDNADGHGDETAWTVAADLIGATHPSKRGAHNGWTIPHADADPNDPQYFVRAHGGQPGSTWDMYGVRRVDDPVNGFAGSIGSRLGCPPTGQLVGKTARIAPTLEMLETYYGLVYLTSADLASGILGPFSDRGQNDVAILGAFAQGATVGSERGLFVEGNGFAASEQSMHAVFLWQILRANLRNASYASLSGNTAACADLIMGAPFGTGNVYGVMNAASPGNDVLTAVNGASAGSSYQDVPPNGPYVASVHGAPSASEPWRSLLDGWAIRDGRSRFCGSNMGRVNYLYDVFTRIFVAECAGYGGPVTVPDGEKPGRLENAIALLGNPIVGRPLRIQLSVAAEDRAEMAIFDLLGRRARTLLAGPVAPGRHDFVWDGRDDGGRTQPVGVYFVKVRLEKSGFAAVRKTILVR